ncbi:MAG: FtsQ-type POTRA domain-containing protein [bacterium]|nr:FtsQ-type POTRA domain-containing protein [bacterium]
MRERRPTTAGEGERKGRFMERLSALSPKGRRRKEERNQTALDPRIAERARRVQEKEESQAVKRAVWLLSAMTLVGVGIWLLHSPYLAVQEVVVSGEVVSTGSQRVARDGLIEGAPMFLVDTESVREVVLSDPWVSVVEVRKEWPNTVSIAVEERYPVAWVLTGDGWRALSLDGVVLDVDQEQVMPRITGLAGATLDLAHPSIGPALEFVEYLRPDLRLGAVVEIHGQQVTAEVAKRVVRLGRPAELDEKADVLVVLVDDYTDPGSVINLFSPLRPAVYRGTPG